MNKKQHITAFYLETLLMIVVFISIILVLTRVFGRARAQSARARQLTAAVTLAQNAAEAAAASSGPQELLALLEADGNAFLQEDASTGEALVTALYDEAMQPVPVPPETVQAMQGAGSGAGKETASEAVLAAGLLQPGTLIVETAWSPRQEEGAGPGGAPVPEGGLAVGGTLADAVITVFNGASGEAVFSMQTSVYLPGDF